MTDNSFVAASDTWEVGGKTYTLSPIRVKELKELEVYLKAQPLKVLGQVEGLSAEDRKYFLDKAYEDSRQIKVGTQAFNDAVVSAAGISHLVFLSLRPHQPQISKDDVDALISQEKNAEVLLGKLLALMGVKEENPLATAPPPKRKR